MVMGGASWEAQPTSCLLYGNFVSSDKCCSNSYFLSLNVLSQDRLI